ncbi:sugar ABC transporter ATP-binding protein [Teichococcus cervicalis]|uniref:ABC transporter, ATP-binding protein n=1 Tax=Pseudoroseomonas cervicalis ATCC 49957 TaxID=525371 RepID=D5RMX8_9PROT|nr:sugar ABC transporter ATP-binding protein [Pseudoroseomonas cervicalis]EFH11343.1 ABC transporter, ATP-binding protein [Pseudoroseomonas cervicalis ATCC 49957]
MQGAAPILSLEGIGKSYPGVRALDDVSLHLMPGEVLGLIGENGAGKSTLMKVLGGVVAPSAGRIRVGGRDWPRLTVSDAQAAGIAFVHQELNLFDNLDVAANVLFGREPLRGGPLKLVDRQAARARVAPLLARLGADFTPDTPVAALSIAQRQLVEIAKALAADSRIIIFDEPTSSLTLSETARLLSLVHELRAAGTSIIYITHRLAEIVDCADRVVCLRDGRLAGTLARGEIDHAAMIRLMIGRELRALYTPPRRAPGPGGLVLEGVVTDSFPAATADLEIRAGEILGLAGLVGAGRTSLARTLFGLDPLRGGRITLDGKPLRLASPRDAVRAGIYLAPEDRKAAGLVLSLPIAENVSLASLRRFSRMFLVDRREEWKVAEAQARSLRIKAPSVGVAAGTLSGGNQQKVVLAKWLSMAPRVILFDEPTRGIDAGAKGEIYALMRALADKGVAILMISSDMEEVIGVSDRIAVMHEGRISGILNRDLFSEQAVLRLAIGHDEEEAA